MTKTMKAIVQDQYGPPVSDCRGREPAEHEVRSPLGSGPPRSSVPASCRRASLAKGSNPNYRLPAS